MSADAPDQLIEARVQQRFAAAESNDFCSQSRKKIDAARHFGSGYRTGDLVVFVAVCAGEIAAPDGNDVGEDGVAARLNCAGNHPRLTKAPRQRIHFPERPRKSHIHLCHPNERLGIVEFSLLSMYDEGMKLGGAVRRTQNARRHRTTPAVTHYHGCAAMIAKTIIEPFRIKSVEPIRWTTRDAARGTS